MISGAHAIIYSKNPEADRAFLRDILKLPNIDVGDGWLVFGLPPSEVAVHPSGKNNVHEFYFICDDVEALIAALRKRKITCSPVQTRGWGFLTQVVLPGGGELGFYQSRHARPKPMRVGKTTAKRAARARKRTPRDRSKEAKRGR